MKKVTTFLCALVIVGCLASCYTFEHTVGGGAKGSTSVSKKKWFILFGLVPLNSVNSKELAGGASDYTVKTQQSFIDGVIGIFTGIVTIHPMTVTVTK